MYTRTSSYALILYVLLCITNYVLQNLPKTNYYKLIDYWLLFALIILVLICTIHTYVGHLCSKATHEPLAIFKRGKVRRRFAFSYIINQNL